MSDRELNDKEMQKVFLLYEDYKGDPAGFIRMIWAEAYDLGLSKADKSAWVNGYNEGVQWERKRAK